MHTRTHTHIHTDDINYSFEVDDPDSQCETFSINVSPESTDYSAASQRNTPTLTLSLRKTLSLSLVLYLSLSLVLYLRVSRFDGLQRSELA